MPELPEVEVVRRGLSQWVRGRIITDVEVLDARSLRRHSSGTDDFREQLRGLRVMDAVRRGKFLWLPLVPASVSELALAVGSEQAPAFGSGQAPAVGSEPATAFVDAGSAPGRATTDPAAASVAAPTAVVPHLALMAHLGMSGQLLLEESAAQDEKHLKVRFRLSPSAGMPAELRFVDQRIFGGVFLTPLQPTADGEPGGRSETFLPLIPGQAAHIARDPLDPAFSFEEFYQRLRARKTGIKRALLDQSLVSGIGNIYADEALWSARLHFARPTDTLRRAEACRLIDACVDVMQQALDAGGTSFDSLYVNVNGASGYFARSLNAYGRAGQQCRRCAARGIDTLLRRDVFMNRSSFTCPVCQPRPRNARR